MKRNKNSFPCHGYDCCEMSVHSARTHSHTHTHPNVCIYYGKRHNTTGHTRNQVKPKDAPTANDPTIKCPNNTERKHFHFDFIFHFMSLQRAVFQRFFSPRIQRLHTEEIEIYCTLLVHLKTATKCLLMDMKVMFNGQALIVSRVC